MNARQKRGYTLVEYLVVFGLIALSTVIGITVYKNVYQDSRAVTNTVDLRTMNNAVEYLRFKNRNAPSLVGSNDAAQHSAVITALATLPDNPLRGLTIDPAKLTSQGSGSTFRFTNYASGAVVQGNVAEGNPPIEAAQLVSSAPDSIVNLFAISQLVGGSSNALDAIETAVWAPGIKAMVGMGGQQYLYELVSGSDATSLPDVVRPADYGVGNNKVWRLRQHQGVLQVKFNLSDLIDKAAARTSLELADMALQRSNAVNITGGRATIDQNSFTVGDQIVATADGVRLAGRLDGAMQSATTIEALNSTWGAGIGLKTTTNTYTLLTSGSSGTLPVGSFGIFDKNRGVFRLSLLDDGNATVSGRITAPSFQSTSSIRFKDNVQPMRGALEKIRRLRAITYDNKPGYGNPDQLHDIGFLAEDVDLVFPEIVAKDREGKPVSVGYDRLTAPLAGAVSELSGSVAALEARLAKLEDSKARFSALSTRDLASICGSILFIGALVFSAIRARSKAN